MSGNQRNRRDKVWVSHNRVLIGGNKKNVRNPNFDTEETKLLISLWGNPAIQKTLITSHKKFPIITKLSETMRQYGYQRTPEEINTRLKNLKCLYNRLKKDVECGIRSHPTWKHFGAMDAILTRPIFGYQNSVDSVDEDEDEGQVMIKGEVDVDLGDDDELRPEDLLQVEETPVENLLPEEDDVQIKDEPIDVDEYDDKKNAKLEEEAANRPMKIEKLPKLIPRSSWLNGGTSNNNVSTCREQNLPPPLQNSQSKITRQSSVICVSAPRSLATVTTTTTSNGHISGQMSPQSQGKGKISLVPTNLLLNQQKQLQQQQQTKNYFVSKNVSTITPVGPGQAQSKTIQAAGPMVTADKSKMPMKVLLVNTMPNHAQMSATPTNSSNSCNNNNKAEIIPLPMEPAQHQTHFQAINKLPVNQIPIRQTPPPPPLSTSRRSNVGIGKAPKRSPASGQSISVPGIKSLISNLIRTQQEANGLNRERLQLDRERFNYERRAIDEVMCLVPILRDIGATFLQQRVVDVVGERHVNQSPSPNERPAMVVQCNGHGQDVGGGSGGVVAGEEVVATTEEIVLEDDEDDEEENEHEEEEEDDNMEVGDEEIVGGESDT